MNVKILSRDQVYLAARLHGRRSRLAEGSVLDELCRVRTVAELAQRLAPEMHGHEGVALQRHLIMRAVDELGELAEGVKGGAFRYLQWLRRRYQMESLKVAIRGVLSGANLESIREAMILLPEDLELALDRLEFSTAGGELALIEAVAPEGEFKAALREATNDFSELPEVFVLETALDWAYLRRLAQLHQRLPADDRQGAQRLLDVEIDGFNIALVMRGKFHYGLTDELLWQWHVKGGHWTIAGLRGLYDLADAGKVAEAASSRMFPGAPPARNTTDFEQLFWSNYFTIGNALFRRRHMQLGAIIGFTAIRRIELANLITLVEGIRLRMEPVRIRQRLLPRHKGSSTNA